MYRVVLYFECRQTMCKKKRKIDRYPPTHTRETTLRETWRERRTYIRSGTSSAGASLSMYLT